MVVVVTAAAAAAAAAAIVLGGEGVWTVSVAVRAGKWGWCAPLSQAW